MERNKHITATEILEREKQRERPRETLVGLELIIDRMLEILISGGNRGMNTHQPKGEDHYQCRKVRAERNRLHARIAELELGLRKEIDRRENGLDGGATQLRRILDGGESDG